jgi:hypothetical protein
MLRKKTFSPLFHYNQRMFAEKIRPWLILTSVCLCATAFAAQRKPATGPLRVLPSNPRWFTDGSGKAVYLTGSHTWYTLQDNGLLLAEGTGNPPPVFDYAGYLDFMERHNHNFFRLWRWETPRWTDRYTKGSMKYAQPHPWQRTGPGTAKDGEPKFDLTRFNEEYFERMRSRLIAARDRGIYAAVMLFEGWELQFSDAWECHPFNGANNVNGVEGGALAYNTLVDTAMGKRVRELQEAYIRKVIDTVNDLDNVLYEVCNEAHGDSTEWQYHIIRFVKEYEKGKPKQHPVGMTFQYKGGTNANLYNSPADWISPNPGDSSQNYVENPCANCTTKVVVSDTDHLWGHTGGDNIWVWKSFTRGLNVLFMEELLPPPTWQDSARSAMGQALRYAATMNLAAMTPEEKLSATRYCLAQRGREYLVFQSNKGEFTLNLTDAPGTFSVEWLNINEDRTVPAKSVDGGAVRTFRTPFPGPAALHLKRAN